MSLFAMIYFILIYSIHSLSVIRKLICLSFTPAVQLCVAMYSQYWFARMMPENLRDDLSHSLIVRVIEDV